MPKTLHLLLAGLVLVLHDMAGGAKLRAFGFGQKIWRPQGQKQTNARHNEACQQQVEGFWHRFPSFHLRIGTPPTDAPTRQGIAKAKPAGPSQAFVSRTRPQGPISGCFPGFPVGWKAEVTRSRPAAKRLVKRTLSFFYDNRQIEKTHQRVTPPAATAISGLFPAP